MVLFSTLLNNFRTFFVMLGYNQFVHTCIIANLNDSTPHYVTQVIVLPQEPDEDDTDVVTITIHTIFDQRLSRRFTYSTKLQVTIKGLVLMYEPQ